MDKRKSFLNVSISILSRIILLFAALFVKRLLIQCIGNDVNGLNSLYCSIIGMLAVAELGVGSAITFSMYKPIVEGDKKQIAALYCLYRKLYKIIGGVILGAGLIIMPFLPRLINDYQIISVNVYGTFLLMLISVVISYLYGAKTSLIIAYKDNYITTSILTISRLMRYGLQIATILIWKSFAIYLACMVFESMMMWSLTEMVVRHRFGEIISKNEIVDNETKAKIIRNIKAMFMHKIGNILVNTIDSLIISCFIGVLVLGRYSNYTLIAGIVTSVISLFFSPLTAVVGHLCAKSDLEKTKNYFDYFYCINYMLGVVFFLGYYAVIDNVVIICFGTGLEVSGGIALIITLNEFTKYMRRATLLFRDASGAFYYDRWKPVVEGLCNLVLSLLFVRLLPEDLKIVGVIVATIITTLVICDLVDPYVVFKHVFGMMPWKFYVKNYTYIGLFTVSLFVMSYLRLSIDNNIVGFFLNGLISIGISIAGLGLVAAADKTFRTEIQTIGHKAIASIGARIILK